MGTTGWIILLVIACVVLFYIYVQRNKKTAKVSDDIEQKKVVPAEQGQVLSDAAEVDSDADELIAVISAAVAAALGRPVNRIKVRSIRRLGPIAPSWVVAGRQDQMNDRF